MRSKNAIKAALLFLFILFAVCNLFCGLGKGDGFIILRIRLPEVLAAVFAGFALGAAGAVSQIIFKNPLADPYILGISSGSALGISVCFLTGLYYLTGFSAVIGSALFGGILSVFIIMGIRRIIRKQDHLSLLLSGIVYGYIAGALSSVILSNIERDKIYSIVQWLFGTFSFYDIRLLIVFTAAAFGIFLFILSRSATLDLMNFSDKKLQTLGIDPGKERTIFFIAVSVLVAMTVSVTGIIGFVGLMAPHFARVVTGSKSRALLVLSGFIGALLTLSAALISRLFTAFYMPVGMVLSLLGGAYFIIFYRGRNGIKI